MMHINPARRRSATASTSPIGLSLRRRCEALLAQAAVLTGLLTALVSHGVWAQGQAAPVRPATSAAGQPQSLPMITLAAGMHRIQAQVADSPEERAVGLMHRREMPANDGMLFVFDQAQPQCFWMKNTLMPLSIAFLKDDGAIVNVAEMKANTTDNHCSAAPVRYALEMNAGWFTKKGLKAGDKISGGPFQR